jgi:hypothetical protein
MDSIGYMPDLAFKKLKHNDRDQTVCPAYVTSV